MICPKCNKENEEIYSFCLECGAKLPTTSEAPEEEFPTVHMSSDKLPTNQTNSFEDETATVVKSSSDIDELPTVVKNSSEIPQNTQTQHDEPPPTEFYSAKDTVESKNQQTQVMSSDKLPSPETYSQENLPENEPPATEYYSSQDSSQNAFPPTEMHSSRKTVEESPAETVHYSNQTETPKQDFVQPEPIKTKSEPKISQESIKVPEEPKKPPRRLRKFLFISTTFLLLLLVGGGTAAYFLLPPPQKSRSYFLYDKRPNVDKVLDFDDQVEKVFMNSPEQTPLQSWGITPNPDDANYYRFVNRGVGAEKSLEVVDDKVDSSVSMSQSAIDVGQSWAITNVEGNFYRITNKWLGDSKSLSHNKRRYYFLRVRDTKNTPGQLWKRTPAKNGGYFISNRRYGNRLALEAIAKGDYADKLRMSKSDNLGNQVWEIKPVGNDYFNLTTSVHKGNKFLDINASKKDRVTMAKSGNSAGQKWKFTPVGNGYYRITNESLGKGKSLEAVTFSKYVVEMVKTSDKDLGQLWKIERIGR